jgi:hypothetical protein
MTHKSLLPLAATLLAAFVSSTSAATIVADGTQFIGESYNAEGIAWRQASVDKTYDIDGDDVLGTAGYYLAKTNTSGGNEDYSGSNFDTSVMTFSNASWVSVSASDTQVNNQVNYGYRQFQDPLAPAGKLSVGYMGRRFSSTLDVGTFYSLYNFTLGVGLPGDFTVTIATHPEIGTSGIPSGLRLTQIAGSGSDSQTISISAGSYSDFNAAFTTFRITGAQSGDVFQLLGQAGGAENLLINGIMLDAVAAPIPEPASFAALAGLATLGLVATRRRRSAR